MAGPHDVSWPALRGRVRSGLARDVAIAPDRLRALLRAVDRGHRGPAALSAGLPARRDGCPRGAPAREHDRRAGAARRHLRPQRRPACLHRRRRFDHRRSHRDRRPRRGRRERLWRAGSLRRWREGGNRQEPAAQGTVRVGRAQGVARRGAAGAAARDQGHRVRQGEPPVLSEARDARARARLRGARQRRPRRSRELVQRPDQRPRGPAAHSARRPAPGAHEPRRTRVHGRRGARADD